MAPISATTLQKDLFNYLNRTIDKNEILNVSTQKGNVIILNATKYEELEELEAIRQSDEDIANGRTYPQDEVYARLDAKIKARKEALNHAN
ncbi:hypothetical protein FACS1894211_02600 [Clostridia bacterium]|nr:hypothetical protein FACS1894211_02600 [Clostridia bacterium]